MAVEIVWSVIKDETLEEGLEYTLPDLQPGEDPSKQGFCFDTSVGGLIEVIMVCRQQDAAEIYVGNFLNPTESEPSKAFREDMAAKTASENNRYAAVGAGKVGLYEADYSDGSRLWLLVMNLGEKAAGDLLF